MGGSRLGLGLLSPLPGPGPSPESLFIFQPFELRPWSRARGGGEVFEATEIWFHPKKESHEGAVGADLERGVERGSGRVDTGVLFHGGAGGPDTWVLMLWSFGWWGNRDSGSLALSVLGPALVWGVGGWGARVGGSEGRVPLEEGGCRFGLVGRGGPPPESCGYRRGELVLGQQTLDPLSPLPQRTSCLLSFYTVVGSRGGPAGNEII